MQLRQFNWILLFILYILFLFLLEFYCIMPEKKRLIDVIHFRLNTLRRTCRQSPLSLFAIFTVFDFDGTRNSVRVVIVRSAYFFETDTRFTVKNYGHYRRSDCLRRDRWAATTPHIPSKNEFSGCIVPTISVLLRVCWHKWDE